MGVCGGFSGLAVGLPPFSRGWPFPIRISLARLMHSLVRRYSKTARRRARRRCALAADVDTAARVAGELARPSARRRGVVRERCLTNATTQRSREKDEKPRQSRLGFSFPPSCIRSRRLRHVAGRFAVARGGDDRVRRVDADTAGATRVL